MITSQTKLIDNMKVILGQDGITDILGVIYRRLMGIAKFTDQAQFRRSYNDALRFVFSFYGETDNAMRFLKMLAQTKNKAAREKFIDIANWDEDVHQVFVEKYRPNIPK